MTKQFPKIAILAVAILWGSSFAFQKGLLEVIDPITFTFYNFFVVGVLFLLYAIFHKRNLFYRWREGILLGVLITGTEVAQMIGLHLSSAANTSFISNVGMLLIPYVGFMLYRHKVTKMDTFTIIGAAMGMYLLLGGIKGVGVGDIFLLISACFMAFYFLLSERYEGEAGGYMSVLCAQQFLIVGLLTGVYILFTQITFSVASQVLPTFAWQIFVFTALPYALIQWSSKYANEMMVTMYDGVVEPLVGGLVAWGLFYEHVTPLKVMGALIMVICFGISAIYSERQILLSKKVISKKK
ncbi:MAG: DMT(drug/metabolite transporter) superfamily permease [Candidatus Nomurabacteria bacterium]|nr:DMT(drug/metabolite transporter) superfamily permease [Candidatus Nomurabacteria bacterium]